MTDRILKAGAHVLIKVPRRGELTPEEAVRTALNIGRGGDNEIEYEIMSGYWLSEEVPSEETP